VYGAGFGFGKVRDGKGRGREGKRREEKRREGPPIRVGATL
jgi:hypothetical protein